MEHTIEVQLKTTYHTLNELNEDTEYIWLVFHGYGQLAAYFIKKFEGLDPKKHFVVAPEGLSKFYLQGYSGRVGASWMTKENRQKEIHNQFTYLTRITHQLGDVSGKKLIYLGFSQGAATMGRFAAYAKLPFHHMILWAGIFPHDATAEDFDFLTGEEKITCFIGRHDPFFEQGMLSEHLATITLAVQQPPAIQEYDGAHSILLEVLNNFVSTHIEGIPS